MQRIWKSFKNVDLRLFASLLVLGLCPTIYTTLRVFFIGQLPGEWSYSIAGQLSWVNLLYEVLSEAIILPLFFHNLSLFFNISTCLQEFCTLNRSACSAAKCIV